MVGCLEQARSRGQAAVGEVMRIGEVEFDMSVTTCSLRFYIIQFSTYHDKLERVIGIEEVDLICQ